MEVLRLFKASKSSFDDANDNDFESATSLSLLHKRDPAFLSSLFVELNPALLRFLASHKVVNENAEELIHECWETFFKNLDKFEGRSKIRTFLFGILINKIREHRRRIGRIDLEEDSEKLYAKSFTTDGWWASEPADPQRLLENSQLGLLIEECLDSLSDLQKSAFTMVESEGESSTDTCKILDISLSHLGVLIFRAKAKLRLCLEGRLPHAP